MRSYDVVDECPWRSGAGPACPDGAAWRPIYPMRIGRRDSIGCRDAFPRFCAKTLQIRLGVPAALGEEALDLPRVADVEERVCLQQNQVGLLADGDGAALVRVVEIGGDV